MCSKQLVRANFRNAVFKRAGYSCQGPGCNFKSSPKKAEQDLDAHHITNRNDLPNGGYVPENGIALCSSCHIIAEDYYLNGHTKPGFLPTDLYSIIKSSREMAEQASLKLK